MDYKISVIIPVYKAEKFIAKCARSLFGQTLDAIEFIFIDDCTPDESINVVNSVLQEFPTRQNDVRIIRHTVNAGVSKSRQNGLDAAKGEYVIHCDSDDWLEPTAYEEMYEKANYNNADIVICDYFKEYGNRRVIERHDKIFPTDNPDGILTALCTGKAFGACWNKLIRRDKILNSKAHFIEGLNVCEDLFFMIMLLKNGSSVYLLERPLYHYDLSINPNSILRSSCSHNGIDNNIIHWATKLLADSKYKPAHDALVTEAMFSIFISGEYSNCEFKKRYHKFNTLSFSNRGYVKLHNRLLLQAAINGQYRQALSIYNFLHRIMNYFNR